MSHMTKTRYPRGEALEVARELCARLKPETERLIVAGSLRRGKLAVGDVEILFIPRYEERRDGLFDAVSVDLAGEVIDRMVVEGTLSRRETSTGRPTWGAKNKLAVHVASGIPVDLFSAPPANWWNYLVCRTGPSESNIRIAEAAKRMGWRWSPYGDGFTLPATGEAVAMTSEQDVFDFVGLPFHEPKNR